MSVNAYIPHLLVLPEDEANRVIANGFVNHVNVVMRAVQVLPRASGWSDVVEKFKAHHLKKMREFPERRILLLIDFDENPEARLIYIENEIPEDVKSRVCVLGIHSEPEKLRSATGKKFEAIGATLANECAEDRRDLWVHELLKHNEPELVRLSQDVSPFLFHGVESR